MSPAEPLHENAASGLQRAPKGIGDKYRSLIALGRGGMGRVEVALERGENGRIVALKRLLPEGAKDRRLSDMFLREARIAGLLAHPNVVRAFDSGEVDGELYLAMEYVEGEPLSRVLAVLNERDGETGNAGGALDPVLAAHVLAEICVGLHAAHDLRDANGTMLNVVHRDVSPHNVMIAYDGRIKLLDFGVAKTDAEGGLTRTGEVKGKVAYMSPEQAMGDALDRRSDLYSIGAVLFECITGRRMWLGTDMEVLRQLALDPPPKLEELAPNAPSQLCALYTRLVAHDPKGRPASAASVADELRAFIGGAHDAAAGGETLRALMSRLFPGAAEKKREEVCRAIELAPDADVLTESPEVPSVAATVSAPRHRSRARVGLVSGTVAVVLCIAGAVVLSKSHSAVPEPAKGTAVIASAPSASLAPAPVAPLASSEPPANSRATPSPASVTPKPNAIRPRPPGAKPGSKAAPHSASPTPPSTPSPTPKRIDVDPDPI